MISEKTVFNTILGNIELKSQLGLLTHCSFVSDDVPLENHPNHSLWVNQILNYLSGDLKTFDIPLQPAGSDFQKEVWETLLTIPYGKTITYGQLADRLGSNANPRNVGGANGANPIAIIIPCHRVVGSNMKLTGYAGGIERKKKLLELEGAILQQSLF
ncbi:MAG: methylated-DNA--[protein]-cysteine S-methyltransferase [Chitinophagales bacterium]